MLVLYLEIIALFIIFSFFHSSFINHAQSQQKSKFFVLIQIHKQEKENSNLLTLSRPSRTASFNSRSLVISMASWKGKKTSLIRVQYTKNTYQATLHSILHAKQVSSREKSRHVTQPLLQNTAVRNSQRNSKTDTVRQYFKNKGERESRIFRC